MDDLDRYIQERDKREPGFAEYVKDGYKEFKIGVMLQMAREEAGMTQTEVAKKLNMHRQAISRLENHATGCRLETIAKYARAIGKDLHLSLV